MRLWLAPLIVASGMGVSILAAPAALACVPGEDINILCSNEEQYVIDLAAAGIVPTSTPRALVNAGNKVCGYLINPYAANPSPMAGGGIKNGAASTLRSGNPDLTWEQVQAWVQAAADNLCPDSATGMHLQ